MDSLDYTYGEWARMAKSASSTVDMEAFAVTKMVLGSRQQFVRTGMLTDHYRGFRELVTEILGLRARGISLLQMLVGLTLRERCTDCTASALSLVDSGSLSLR
jgi:hypothetical protein